MAENNQQGFNDLCVRCADLYMRFGNRHYPIHRPRPVMDPRLRGGDGL